MEEEQTSKRRPARRWKFLVVLAAAFLMLFFWDRHLFNQRKSYLDASTDPLPQVVVKVIEPNTKPIELILPSSAQAWHITPIWSRVNGYLIRYLVDIGDTVKQGDLLAEIDTPEADEQLAQAQANYKNSVVERDIAKITNDRWQRLWNKNTEAVAKQEVDQYHANYLSTDAIVNANEKNVSRLTYQQQFKYIYAPFDGVIIKRNIDIGSLIYGSVNGTTQELFQLTQTHTIRFFVDVPQNYFRQIKEGIEAEVTVREFPDKIFKGKVTRYAKALDPIARTLLTEVDVENEEGLLYAGLFGRVKFFMEPVNINFIIPTTAVIIRSAFPHVAIVDENNIVHMVEVKIGRDYGKFMEITSGLKANDRIVTIPSDEIQEGVKVELLNGHQK